MIADQAVERHATRSIQLSKLKPHPRNYREHPERQIEQIAISIQEHGQYRPIVTANDHTILAGHGVALALESLGVDVADVIVLDVDPQSPKALRLIAGDNELSRLAFTDDRMLLELLSDAGSLAGTGFDDESLAQLLAFPSPGDADSDAESDSESGGESEYRYTTDTPSPIYTPRREEPPAIDELLDTRKRDALVHDILDADIDHELRQFLLAAAARHAVFDYRAIAEYYAHAGPDVQRLMEDSALVIVDFERAIELGYVKLSQRLTEILESGANDDE